LKRNVSKQFKSYLYLFCTSLIETHFKGIIVHLTSLCWHKWHYDPYAVFSRFQTLENLEKQSTLKEMRGRTQGKPGKIFFFSRCSGKLRDFFMKTPIETSEFSFWFRDSNRYPSVKTLVYSGKKYPNQFQGKMP